MPKFQKMADNLETIKKALTDIGQDIIENYPQSKNLVNLAGEVDAAVTGISELSAKILEAISTAGEEEGLKKDLETQMAGSTLYQALDVGERSKLVEYLISQQAGLATEEDLKAFIHKIFDPKNTEEIIGEFSKPYIINIGKQQNPKADEFNAYTTGRAYLMSKLENPEGKKEIIDLVAKEYLENMPGRLLRTYYDKAFV